MPKNPPHKWHFYFTDSALDALRAMQSGHRGGVFRDLHALVNADAPYDLPFVDKLEGKQFEGIRKFRVAHYRVLFMLDTRPVELQKHRYKGTVVILTIDHRKDVYRP